MAAVLLVRILADCADAAEALRFAAELERALNQFGPLQREVPQRYLKMPQLYEFAYALHPATEATFAQLLALGGSDWWRGGDETDRSAVWNRADGRQFLLPSVHWAELILTRRADH